MTTTRMDFCIFFITSRCDSHCPVCFYRDRLNRDDDLTFDEIKRISSHAGRFSTLLVSGGEPFLRQDLADILLMFIAVNNVRHVSIPTNGLNPGIIYQTLDRLLGHASSRGVRFYINPSLDGLNDIDDTLRGRSEAFLKCSETLQRLAELKKKYSDISISVNTVFSGQSRADMAALIEYVNALDFVDAHNVELARPKTFNEYASIPYDRERIRELHHDIAVANYARVVRKLKSASNPVQWLAGAYRLTGAIGYLRFQQRLQMRFLDKAKTPFRCPAGSAMWVIEADGAVKPCELKQPVGNLRHYDYDMTKLFDSERALTALAAIKESWCICTHTCFISEYLNLGIRRLSIPVCLRIIYYFIVFVLFEKAKRRT